MNSQLEKRWKGLEEAREIIEKEIEKASLPQLKFQESNESWNMLQVMCHLIAVEETGFNFLISKKYMSGRKAKGKMHSLRSFLLQIFLKSPIRFKVPPIPALLPPPEQEKESLFQEWSRTRENIREYLNGYPEDKLDYLIFRHPSAGWLTLEQTLGFLVEHIHHHQQQIKRIQKAPGYPK